ncbi:histone-like nucleoid-structuring protein Lsr2 [Streptomyces cellulosae]
MAQKVEVKLIDDLDGSEAGQTVLFSLDGKEYEIDLNDDHAAELRSALAPFVGAARKTSAARPKGVRRLGSDKPFRDRAGVRAWARANGWPDLSDRGRVPAEILKAYDAAQAA